MEENLENVVTEEVTKEEEVLVENKEEIKEENIDITATGDDTIKAVSEPSEDSITSQDDVEKKESKNISLEIVVANQSKQLEEISNKIKEMSESNTKLTEENTKLKEDIASLRENPFYKPSDNVNDKPQRDSSEYSFDDVEKMRKRI